MSQSIPTRVRLEMLRAAAQVIGDGIGVRMLHIKGDAVDPSLRETRSSGTDVDVLVDPDGVGALHRALRREGWRVYSTFQAGSPFGHAQTYFHDDWGHLDVHRRFPGIQIEDSAAFATLWETRSPRCSAGITYQAPGVDAHAVLLMLNAARDPRRGRAVADDLWARIGDEQRTRCLALVAKLDAVVAFAAAAGQLDSYSHRREYLLWRSVSSGGSRVGEWWGRIRAQRTIRDAISVGMKAVLVNRERLEHRLGRTPSAGDVVVEFFVRTGQGISEAWRSVTRRRG